MNPNQIPTVSRRTILTGLGGIAGAATLQRNVFAGESASTTSHRRLKLRRRRKRLPAIASFVAEGTREIQPFIEHLRLLERSQRQSHHRLGTRHHSVPSSGASQGGFLFQCSSDADNKRRRCERRFCFLGTGACQIVVEVVGWWSRRQAALTGGQGLPVIARCHPGHAFCSLLLPYLNAVLVLAIH